MGAGIETIRIWSYGLAGFVYAIFAIYHSSSWRTGNQNRALFAAIVLKACWGITSLAYTLTDHPFLQLGGLLTDILRYGGWFCFLLILLKPDPVSSRLASSRWKGLVAIAVFLVMLGFAALVLGVAKIDFQVPPHRLMLIDFLGAAVLAIVLVEQLLMGVPRDSRWSIKPLCLGIGGAALFDLYLYSDALLFNRFDTDAFSVRGFIHALAVPLVAISTSRSRNWKKRLVLSQRVALQSASLVAVGLYLLFMSAAGYYVRYFGGEWGRAVQLALLFAALLLLAFLSVSGSMRARFRVLIGKHFFTYRYDYREEWLRFTNALASQDGFREMGQHVIKGLADMVESPAGSLWLKNSSGSFYAQASCWNMPVTSVTESADGSLSRFMQESGWIVNLEEYRSVPQRYENLELPSWMAEIPNAWMVVPLAVGNEMIGFVILATARTELEVDWEVNDLLKTAGRQAGAFLGQMQATESLLEVRKFDAFNRMSAFVVHDLKNIVAQLSLMLKNAERHRDNPEFQKDMLMTVEHSVERMRHLMMQLREGATPVDGPRGVDLTAVIQRIQTAKSSQGRAVEVRLADKVVARGHEDRVERVIGHIVQNALDATERGGRVLVMLEKLDDNAIVIVDDAGHGMSPEFVRERLFKPFQTTKPAGMGIGAYESFQYVHELGGKVTVDSEVNVGTKVRLSLPLYDAKVNENSKKFGDSA